MLDNEVFGEAIVRLRGPRSQRWVAERGNIPAGTLCQWEKGKRRPRKAQMLKLLKGLNCSKEDLDAMIWQIQGEKFKLKGSQNEAATDQALDDHDEVITALLQESLENMPATLRSVVERLQKNVQKTDEKLKAIRADLEALILATRSTKLTSQEIESRASRSMPTAPPAR